MLHFAILLNMAASFLRIIEIVLPVFLTASVGFIFAIYSMRRVSIASATKLCGEQVQSCEREDASGVIFEASRRTLQTFTFQIAGPAFVFVALIKTDVNLGELGLPALFATVMYLVLVLIGILISRLLGWTHDMQKAAILTLSSKNCANYGLPVVLFAFGEQGVLIGTVFVVIHILLHMTVGLMIAAWSKGRSAVWQLTNLFRLPYIYVIFLALVLHAIDVPMPGALERTLSLIGETWIPLMLIMLGIELSAVKNFTVWREAAFLTVVKLAVPVLLAFGFAFLFGITGVARAVLILQGSMPTAVNGLLVARQFDARPDIVASTLLMTTIGSVILITSLLVFFLR